MATHTQKTRTFLLKGLAASLSSNTCSHLRQPKTLFNWHSQGGDIFSSSLIPSLIFYELPNRTSGAPNRGQEHCLSSWSLVPAGGSLRALTSSELLLGLFT